MKLNGIDHVALAVRDIPRSIEWYQRVLHLERRYPEWGNYPAMIGIGTTSLALFPIDGGKPKPAPDRDAVAMRHLAFRASGTEFHVAQSHLQQEGVTFEFQDHGIAHSIYFEDPDGHRLEITTYDI